MVATILEQATQTSAAPHRWESASSNRSHKTWRDAYSCPSPALKHQRREVCHGRQASISHITPGGEKCTVGNDGASVSQTPWQPINSRQNHRSGVMEHRRMVERLIETETERLAKTKVDRGKNE